MERITSLTCWECDAQGARQYQLVSLARPGEFGETQEFALCARCAREERARLHRRSNSTGGLTRREMIAELDRFFAAAGVFEICGRCHQQGTGCCPPTCRVMGAAGCDPANKYGKTVFCAAFVCSALLNAISECDAELGRTLKWIKRELGPAEFHIYEMITRVPAGAREQFRPLALPERYPQLDGLEHGARIREPLLALVEEVLEIRRCWAAQEATEIAAADQGISQTS